MDKTNKSFIKWVLLFAALLYIPAMVLFLSNRDKDDFIERYTLAYAREYAISQSDATSGSDIISDSDGAIYDFIVD